MGRLLENNEKQIIQDNIFQYLENTYSQFNKRFQGTPIYTTYYNQNKNSSTQDQTLDNIQEIIGINSPVQFNRIEGLPLYLVNEINPQMEIDESFGLTTNGEGEGVILPNTIKPYIGDFIYIEIATKKLLFKITSLEIDKFNGQKFYKIQFTITPYKIDEIEEQVEEEYITHYENISTQDKAIVEKKSSILIDKMNLLIIRLINFYKKAFLDSKFNTILCKYNDKLLYNECLIKFINNNKLLELPSKKIYSSLYIQEIFGDSMALLEMYKTTLFYALEEKDFSNFICENFVTIEIIKDLKDNPFSFDYREYFRTYYVTNDSHKNLISSLDEKYDKYITKVKQDMTYDQFDFGKQSSLGYQFEPNPDPPSKERHIIIKPHASNLIKNINNNLRYKNNLDYFLENIIIMYFNNTLEINEYLLSDIEKKNFYPSIKEFLLIPCIIFILKDEIKKLLS